MKKLRLKPFSIKYLIANACCIISLMDADDAYVKDLDPYYVRGSQPKGAADSLGNYLTDGVHGFKMPLSETSRAVNVLTRDIQEDLQINDFADLARYGAGTQRPNYLGIAGTSYLRGDDAGLYFNGMKRAYQLLAFPVSMQSASQQLVIKGPAPVHLGATQAGGYVNQLPKRPGDAPNQLEVVWGSYEHYGLNLDYSGALKTGDRNTRLRLSAQFQDSESFFDEVEDNRYAVYAAVEAGWGDRLSLFAGVEVYRWDGNENPGINRLTQALIDESIYVPAEPANAAQSITLADDKVLVASEDFAEANDFMAFADFQWQSDPDRRITSKWFLEYFDTDKKSFSNQFAFSGQQLAIENKWLIEESLFEALPTDILWGGSIRFNQVEERFTFAPALDALALQDISTRPNPAAIAAFNSVNLGDYYEGSVFASVQTLWYTRLETITSLRLGTTLFDTESTPGRKGQKNTIDLSFNPVFRISKNLNAYASLQQGTALIPGEGGAVTGEANFGQTELYEIGLKGHFLKKTLFSTLAFYYWDKAEFDTRVAASERFRANGLEWESTWAPADPFHLMASFTAQRAWRRGGPPARLGAFDPTANPTHSFLPSGGTLARNPNSIVPGTTEVQAKVFAVVSPSRALRSGIGAIWSDGFWTSYDRFFRVPSSIVMNAFGTYQWGQWSMRLDVENIGDKRYFTGSDPNFLGNAVLTPEAGRSFKLSLSRAF